MISIVENRDCMEAMREFPDKFFDLAVVDPPYGIGLDMIVKNGSQGKPLRQANGKRYKSIHKSKEWNNGIPSEQYFNELHRVSVHQIIWGCNYYARFIPSVGRIIHDKQMGIEGTKINYSHADLASCSMQKRITIFRYRWSGNKQGSIINWDNSGINGRVHPTQKPIELYDWIYDNYLPKGGRVIDTHLGSGSNRIAADKAGNIDFWGYELDKDYYEAQEKRWKDYKAQLKLFV